MLGVKSYRASLGQKNERSLDRLFSLEMEVIANNPLTYCGDAEAGLEGFKKKESVSLLRTELGVFHSIQWMVFYELPQGV